MHPYPWHVPSLPELVRDHTDLGSDDVAWLGLLQADWQIIADLSFADLVLWLPDREGTGYWAAGQMRPTTGPTALVARSCSEQAPEELREKVLLRIREVQVSLYRSSGAETNHPVD